MTSAKTPAKAKAAPAKATRTEYPLIADLPKVPVYKVLNGKVVTQPVKRKDPTTGETIIVEEKILFDPNGELQHRNRYGEMLMYTASLPKRAKAADPFGFTVNDHRYQLKRGVKVKLPWFVVHHFRLNFETIYSQEPDPNHPGRKQIVREDQLSETMDARPIDACDDFDDETAHLPVRPEGADEDMQHDFSQGAAQRVENEEALQLA